VDERVAVVQAFEGAIEHFVRALLAVVAEELADRLQAHVEEDEADQHQRVGEQDQLRALALHPDQHEGCGQRDEADRGQDAPAPLLILDEIAVADDLHGSTSGLCVRAFVS
jgi:hypothetical protein